MATALEILNKLQSEGVSGGGGGGIWEYAACPELALGILRVIAGLKAL